MENTFEEWIENKDGLPKLNEDSNRYSIEVNYRSTIDEVIDNFAKLVLGYVSAGMKNCGYHTKIVFTDKPFRVLVSTRNWDDGEWVGVALYNHHHSTFVLAAGHYNKDRKTVSVQKSHRIDSKSAAEICKELRNLMEKLKKESPRLSNSLEPVKLKRGPKPTHLKKLKKSGKTYKL
jgi:hypothetical protein